MKRFVITLTVAIFTISTVVFAAQTQAPSTRAEILAGIEDVAPSGRIAHGSTSMPSANILAGWDNVIPNAWVRDLIFGGLNTMTMDMEGHWFVNPIVVRNVEVSDDNDGNRTYIFTIYTENRFSDGTPITAAHYVANAAFQTHMYWREIADTVVGFHGIIGVDYWTSGQADTLAGLRLLGDDRFSITIQADYFPRTWETTEFMNHAPLAYFAALPGIVPTDNGSGVFLDGITREIVELGINGTNNDGFRFNPTVVPGTYQFVSLAGNVITLDVNPYFPGTWDGHRPRIQEIVFYYVDNHISDAMYFGQIDMITGESNAWTIYNSHQLLVDQGTHHALPYPRNGYSLIRFHVDHGPTQFAAVRQAIKWLLDREALADIVTDGQGQVIHGPYALGMWWYQEALERGLYDAITIYEFDPRIAIRTLQADGWDLNSQGRRFRPGIDDVRYKLVDGELMRLEILWATWPAHTHFTAEMIEAFLRPNMEAIGMQLTIVTDLDNPLLYAARVDGRPPQFHMFNMGTTFAQTYSPWAQLNPAPEFMGGGLNTNFVQDEELFELALGLAHLDMSTQEGKDQFVDAWIDLMVELSYQVLEIPLFTGNVYDFYPVELQNWNNNSIWGFAPSIIRAYLE